MNGLIQLDSGFMIEGGNCTEVNQNKCNANK